MIERIWDAVNDTDTTDIKNEPTPLEQAYFDKYMENLYSYMKQARMKIQQHKQKIRREKLYLE